jgi:WD40 repeat protein
MVLSALIEQIVPSQRGLKRDESLAIIDDAHVWHYHQHDYQQQQQQPQQHSSWQNGQSATTSMKASSPIPQPILPPTTAPLAATRPRRKRCRAGKCLSSMASDFDVITDWVFYFHCRYEDAEYRKQYEESPVEGLPPRLIPSWILWLILAVCVAGTVVWLTLATDGALASPLLRLMGYDKLSMGYLLFLSVMVEDIPQVILTFLVEDYFEENTEFNNYAIVNVIASLYDTLIKLAEAFDERADIVETGIWCKESLWAHKKRVTCVVPIPVLDVDDEVNDDGSGRFLSMGDHELDRSSAFPSSSSLDAPRRQFASAPSWRSHAANPMQLPVHNAVASGGRSRNILQEAQEIVSDTKLPRLTFLSASMDNTVRLWDTFATKRRPGEWRDKCVRTYTGQHRLGISCMAYLGDTALAGRRNLSHLTNQHDLRQHLRATSSSSHLTPPPQTRNDSGILAPTSSPSPLASMQALKVEQQQRGRPPLHAQNTVHPAPTSLDGPLQKDPLASSRTDEKKRSAYFLTGSYDGTAKLWNVRTGECLRTYCAPAKADVRGETIKVTSIASFCTRPASPAAASRRTSFSASSRNISVPPPTPSGASTTNLNCCDSHDLFVCGYKNGKARLWEIWSGKGLGEFHGHSGAILSVCSLEDTRHFATASKDGRLKVWSIAAICMGTTNGLSHSDPDPIPLSSAEAPASASLSSTLKNSINRRNQDLSQALLVDGISRTDNRRKGEDDKTQTSSSPIQEVADLTFTGHTGAVTSVKCVVPGLVLLSGSEDRTARLWSVETGACLRIFVGHADCVTSVGVVDSVTFLTGSRDTTIKVWDGISASCIRTYTGHSGTVTSVSTTSQSGTFISASEDLTVKLWVFTAVLPSLTSVEDGTLNDVLGVDDGLCAAWRGESQVI